MGDFGLEGPTEELNKLDKLDKLGKPDKPGRGDAAAAASEARLREVFEFAASGMAITDLEGRFQHTNPLYREILGRSEEDLEAETFHTITHDEDQAVCESQTQRLLRGEIPSFVLEKRYVRVDGSTVWVRNSFSLLKDSTGQAQHIVLICNDISERRRAEALLIESEKLAVAGQLAASVAHEINNPLEAVMNLLYLVQHAESLEQSRAFAVLAEQEVQRAAEIATQTLRFHRQNSKPLSTDLAELVSSVLVLFKHKLLRARIELLLETEGAPELICYPSEIRQVLANLIRNGMDAMPDGGRLRIRVGAATERKSGGAAVRLTVADTGKGMSRHTQRRLFEPFYTTKGSMGTGLGLWVTKGIVTKHRGVVQVCSSDTPGRSGSAFSMVFPLCGLEADAGDAKENAA